ncbi:hypothetical protein MLD38_022032 [Melastoma candidum]|uniref:Uncharacterized protein n=1 Tax=Melastoma candidum TaxID=119954 RepID=A0ACB9QKW8_9MYRT|nr:hypothetical protein MLD38_022032 [Melastoma candidum]
MGGGTALRSAAKVAGVGSVSAGLRGMPESAAIGKYIARNAGGSPPAALSAQGVCEEVVSPASSRRTQWSIDDWEEVASVGEDGSLEATPRVVFAGTPTFDEAKAATNELKDAIDVVYLSKSKDEIPDGVSPLADGTVSTSSAPNHAIQAFKLLSQSPAAQDVVASVASDPKVWNAFLQNEALKDFMRARNSGIRFPLTEPKPEESVDEASSEGWRSPGKLEELSNYSECSSNNHENGFVTVLQNVKLTVVEMVSGISGFLHNIFNPPAAEKLPASDCDNGSRIEERTMGASFMGLAVLVIMVVLLKRV